MYRQHTYLLNQTKGYLIQIHVLNFILKANPMKSCFLDPVLDFTMKSKGKLNFI